MGSNVPRKFAGHGMPCPYEMRRDGERYCCGAAGGVGDAGCGGAFAGAGLAGAVLGGAAFAGAGFSVTLTPREAF